MNPFAKISCSKVSATNDEGILQEIKAKLLDSSFSSVVYALKHSFSQAM